MGRIENNGFQPILPQDNFEKKESAAEVAPKPKSTPQGKAQKFFGSNPSDVVAKAADKAESVSKKNEVFIAPKSVPTQPTSFLSAIKRKLDYLVTPRYPTSLSSPAPTEIAFINQKRVNPFLSIKQAASRCFFYLAGLIIKNLVNKKFAKFTGGIVDGGAELAILPALAKFKRLVNDPDTNTPPPDEPRTHRRTGKPIKHSNNIEYMNASSERLKFKDTKCLEEVTIRASDNNKLEGSIVYANESIKDRPKEAKWIIRYLASGDCYQNKLNSEEIARYRKERFNVVLFNYRGVMDSEGYPKDVQHDLLADGTAPISFLKERGVDPKNITLVGESLGGGIATEVAALNPGVRLANLRSFASLTAVVQGQIHDFFGRGALATFTAYVVSRIAGGVLSTLGWEINSAKAWQKIPLKDKWMVTASKDDVIKSMGKLYRVVTPGAQSALKKLPKGRNPDRAYARAFVQRNFHAIKAHGADHNVPLTDDSNKTAFEEHIRYLHHTPNEIFQIIKDENPFLFTQKLSLLKELPVNSALFEDAEFYNAAHKIAEQATPNAALHEDGLALMKKLHLHDEGMKHAMGL